MLFCMSNTAVIWYAVVQTQLCAKYNLCQAKYVTFSFPPKTHLHTEII